MFKKGKMKNVTKKKNEDHVENEEQEKEACGIRIN